MTYKRLIVLLGIFLSNLVPAAAQMTAPQIVPAQEHAALAITMPRPVSTPSLNASFLLYQDPRNTPAQFRLLSAGADEPDYIVAPLPPINEVKTLLFTQSSMPLFRLWRGHLQLNGFQNTLFLQNVQLDPLGYGGALELHPRRIYPGGPRTVDLVGVSLSFHFGRNARAAGPTQARRYLSWIVGNVLH